MLPQLDCAVIHDRSIHSLVRRTADVEETQGLLPWKACSPASAFWLIQLKLQEREKGAERVVVVP